MSNKEPDKYEGLTIEKLEETIEYILSKQRRRHTFPVDAMRERIVKLQQEQDNDALRGKDVNHLIFDEGEMSPEEYFTKYCSPFTNNSISITSYPMSPDESFPIESQRLESTGITPDGIITTNVDNITLSEDWINTSSITISNQSENKKSSDHDIPQI